MENLTLIGVTGVKKKKQPLTKLRNLHICLAEHGMGRRDGHERNLTKSSKEKEVVESLDSSRSENTCHIEDQSFSEALDLIANYMCKVPFLFENRLDNNKCFKYFYAFSLSTPLAEIK